MATQPAQKSFTSDEATEYVKKCMAELQDKLMVAGDMIDFSTSAGVRGGKPFVAIRIKIN